MAEIYSSNGKGNLGVTLGAIGTGLGIVNGGLGNLGLGNWGNGYARTANGCGCSEDHLVDRYTLGQEQKISALESQIALRDANTYSDQKSIELYKDINARLRELEAQIAAQAVKNQAVADSFQMTEERLACCKNELEGKICREKDERRCADNSIITYLNATFYPKQVADVTTGTTTTAQALYNPLPACSCSCN